MAFGTGNVIQMNSSAPNVIRIQYASFVRDRSLHAAHGDERDGRQPEKPGELADVDETWGSGRR